MTTEISRRQFLGRGTAVGTGLLIAGPLQAFAARAAAGAPVETEGYGALVDMGELSLPRASAFASFRGWARS